MKKLYLGGILPFGSAVQHQIDRISCPGILRNLMFFRRFRLTVWPDHSDGRQQYGGCAQTEEQSDAHCLVDYRSGSILLRNNPYKNEVVCRENSINKYN